MKFSWPFKMRWYRCFPICIQQITRIDLKYKNRSKSSTFQWNMTSYHQEWYNYRFIRNSLYENQAEKGRYAIRKIVRKFSGWKVLLFKGNGSKYIIPVEYNRKFKKKWRQFQPYFRCFIKKTRAGDKKKWYKKTCSIALTLI